MSFSINIKGRIMDFSQTRIMGIINMTPDSFYEKSRQKNRESALKKIDEMIKEGADIIDIGGYSSRPGANDISAEEEIDRIIWLIEWLAKNTDICISTDTFRASVAREAIRAGAHIINDISAGEDDPAMIPLIAAQKTPYIIMHKKGNPKTMQQMTQYSDVSLEIFEYLLERKEICKKMGIQDLIVDPGFGFAKNIDQNFELLANLSLFKQLELPILTGISRKSMIYKTLHTKAEEALNGSTFLHAFCLQGGASILRVHDVKAARECVQLYQRLANREKA